ncbi:MAG: mevalonate kinase [Archaeoglobi archaeon]|nr:mevalonate kinase [Archaeoglobi archaeon]MDK2782169.1 mevalonate kinase [Archaeoglobi archaeon]
MIRVSAPGKIYFCGEHAVVYGKHGIAGSVNLRTYVEVERSSEFLIDSYLGISRGLPSEIYPYVSRAVEKISEFHKPEPLKIKITSEIPPASGLGSSASVTVAVLKALSLAYDLELEREEIARIAHEVERDVQGSASRTDTFVSTFGGIRMLPEGEEVSMKGHADIIIAFTGVSSSTKELVSSVRALRDRYPEILDEIMDVIDALSFRVKEKLEKGDLRSLGELMNINQGLLDSIGVSNKQISSMVYAAREKGAYGAKITGAGGGGSIIVLSPPEKSEEIKEALSPLARSVLRTSIDFQGVREE